MTAGGIRIEGERRERLRAALVALGFDEVRFAAIAAPRDRGLRAWLEAGYHAQMEWMAATAAKREDPDQVLCGARTAIVLGVNYWPDAPTAVRWRHWARYALYSDYHDTLRPGLVAAGQVLERELGAQPEDYRCYTDTGPVAERGWAAEAGVGFRGKNAMLISRRFGNWLFLATILARAEIAPDPPLRRAGDGTADTAAGALCGKCTRCLDACPTAAFPRPGVVDARRCVSYLTIEHRGAFPRELRRGVGARLFGCDVCLEVCPWNRFARAGRMLLLARRYDLASLRLLDFLRMTPERYREVFRRTPVKRLKLAGLLRNACIVAGNVWRACAPESVEPSLATPQERAAGLEAVRALAVHESAPVRAHAVWAVREIAGEAVARELLAEARTREREPAVLEEYVGL